MCRKEKDSREKSALVKMYSLQSLKTYRTQVLVFLVQSSVFLNVSMELKLKHKFLIKALDITDQRL